MARNDDSIDPKQLIRLAMNVQGDQATVLWREFQSHLESDPNNLTALYGSHMLSWRQGSMDAATDYFHRLLSNIPRHLYFVQQFMGHLPSYREYEILANAYLSRYPGESFGYMLTAEMYNRNRRKDLLIRTLRQCWQNTNHGIHFQPSVIASVFDAGKGAPCTSLGDLSLVESTRDGYSSRRHDPASDPRNSASVWMPLEISDRRVVLAAAVDDADGKATVTFRVRRVGAPDDAEIATEGAAVAAKGQARSGIRHFLATLEGLSPGAEYRFDVVARGAAAASPAGGGVFRTLSHERPEATTKKVEPAGRNSAYLNGVVAGTTLPTRYHFRYGKSPRQLRRRTPVRHLPAGRFGRVRDTGENVFRRLTAVGFGVCFVRPDLPAVDDGDAGELPPCLAAMKIEWPFGKDRNHLDGIGVIDLLAGWRSRAHLRGHVPPAYDAETFPKPRYPGEAVDLRDAAFAVAYRSTAFDAKAFYPVAWVHAGTGKALDPERSENLAAWARTGELGTRTIVDDGRWRRLAFDLSGDSTAWTFAGSNVEEMGAGMQRYTYLPLDAALGENLCGNICLCFVKGDELAPPEGDIEIGAVELAYRSRSLLLPSQGTALVSWPAGTACDPGLLTGGWIGDLDHCWQTLSGSGSGKNRDFVWRFREPASISAVRLHQHPVWPAKEVEVAVSQDGKKFQAIWTGALNDVPEDPEEWNRHEDPLSLSGFAEVAVLERPIKARYFRLRLLSGHREDGVGLDAVEVFGDAPAPLPSPEPCNVCEAIDGIGPGPAFAQLVTENDAGRAEGEIVEISLPANDRPIVMTAEVIERSETEAAVRVRANAMGSPATLSLRLRSGRGKTIAGPKVSIGKWPIAGDAVIRVGGLKPGPAYKGACVAANEHGRSAPFAVAIGPFAAGRRSGKSPPAK